MASKVAICNLALGWLGENPITAITDPSRAAQLCNTNFDLLRDAVLEEGEWGFALKQAGPLAPVSPGPTFGPGSLFNLPEDCLRVLRCLDSSDVGSISSVFTDGMSAFPASRLQWRREGRAVRAEVTAIYVEYIAKITDTELFSPGFTQAMAARLAAELSMPITNSATMFQTMWKLYSGKLRDGLNLDNMQGRQQPIRSDQLTRVR